MASSDNSHSRQPFSGIVTGRRLLQVVGVRCANEYKSDKDADEFWLILEGDTPDKVLWVHPYWQYFGANHGFQMAFEARLSELSQRPDTVPLIACAKPDWQVLVGLHLQEVHLPDLYSTPSTLGLSFQFGLHEQATDGFPVANLLFDSDDLDEPYSMVVTGDRHLLHWALQSDVQGYVSNGALPWEISWSAPWNTPPAPWNEQAHYAALAHLRATLQDFTLWWQTQTEWPIATRSRHGPMADLWQALNAACALQIALSHGLSYPHGITGVDTAPVEPSHSEETNLLFGLGATDLGTRERAVAAYVEEMQWHRDGIVNAIRWMAWDDWHSLLGAESGILYSQTKVRWNTLLQAYVAWFQRNAALWELQTVHSASGTCTTVTLPKPPLLFHPDQTLTLHGQHALCEVVIGYCDAHGYLLRRISSGVEPNMTAERLQAWRTGFRQALAAFADARVWAHVWHTPPDTPDNASERTHVRLYLSQPEAHYHQNRVHPPLRHRWTLRIGDSEWPSSTAAQWRQQSVQAMTLAELCDSDLGIQELIDRLEKEVVTPYSAADWQTLQHIFGDTLGEVFTDTNGSWRAMPLACGLQDQGEYGRHGRLLVVALPSAWHGRYTQREYLGPWALKLSAHGHLVVFDEAGLGRILAPEPDESLQHADAPSLPVWVTNYLQAAQDPQSSATDLAGPYTYLNTRNAELGWLEASTTPLVQDAHGDWVCELIDVHGHLLTAPDVVALVGGADLQGCLVKRRAQLGPRHLGWLPLSERDMPAYPASATDKATFAEWQLKLWRVPHVRWADMLGESERRRPVQDPTTQLWGWADQAGRPAIAPRYAAVGHFSEGLARAWSVDKSGPVGLVNHLGQWVQPPQWRSVHWQRSDWIVVQNMVDEWGVLSVGDLPPLPPSVKGANQKSMWHGTVWAAMALQFRMLRQWWLQHQAPANKPQTIVPLKSGPHWLQQAEELSAIREARFLPSDKPKSREQQIVDWLIALQKDRFVYAVARAKTEPNLASLACVFDHTATKRDLHAAGLLGMRVRLLRDKTEGLFAAAGSTGRIDTLHPVSLSTFDLRVQAPVMELTEHEHQVLGVAWGDLRCDCMQMPTGNAGG